jgi:hypothetical protein
MVDSTEFPLRITARFVRTRVPPIQQRGKYRGAGLIVIGVDTIRVEGRRVPSIFVRWAIGIASYFCLVVLAAVVSTLLVPKGGGPFQTGLSIVFIAVGYAVANILSVREDVDLSYDHVTAVAVNSSEQLLALSLANDAASNPIVARVDDPQRIANIVSSRLTTRSTGPLAGGASRRPLAAG